MTGQLTVTSRINDRYQIELTPDRHEFHSVRPGWERERLDSCFELMKPGMIVYDVGAECGDFTALYGLFVQHGTVVPVEPQPAYWPAIRAHWEANHLGQIQAWFLGFASDVTRHPTRPDGLDELRLAEPGSGWPWASVGEVKPDYGFRHLAQQADHTPQIRLDDLVRLTALTPDAIVMDIEGAEWHALQGCTRIMQLHHPIMWVSIHPGTMMEWYGKTTDDIVRYMANHGYAGEMLGSDSEDYWLFR